MLCDKVKYSSRQAAEEFISEVKKGKHFFRSKVKPVRAYHCSQCKAWHVTSNKKKAHASRSLTKELHTIEIKRPRPLFILDLTSRSLNNMGRNMFLLLSLSMIAVTASGFTDTRASDETTFQVIAYDDYDYSVPTVTITTLDVELPAEFVINHPELGRASAVDVLIKAKASKGYLAAIRGPPDSCIHKSVYC